MFVVSIQRLERMELLKTVPSMFPTIALAIVSLVMTPTATTGQERIIKRSEEVLRANESAAHLYSDQLQMTVTLVNLPGAKNAQSSFTGSCSLFFVPEADWIKTTRQMPEGGIKLQPSDFKAKVELAEVNFKRTSLAELKDRIQSKNNIPFGSRIPVEQKTKLARLMTNCSVKIYDGQLKSSVFSSGVLVTRPFEAELENSGNLRPRRNIYVSFLVTPEGKIYRSQAPRNNESLEWP